MENKIEELKQLWKESVLNDDPNQWELFRAYSRAKIDNSFETSENYQKFKIACKEFNNACKELNEKTEKFWEITNDGLTQSAKNFNEALEYSNKTIEILKEIAQK